MLIDFISSGIYNSYNIHCTIAVLYIVACNGAIIHYSEHTHNTRTTHTHTHTHSPASLSMGCPHCIPYKGLDGSGDSVLFAIDTHPSTNILATGEINGQVTL